MTSIPFSPDMGVRASSDKSVWRRAYEGLINARARRVQLHVNAHLLGMDDKTLVSLGCSRQEIQRQGAQATPLF